MSYWKLSVLFDAIGRSIPEFRVASSSKKINKNKLEILDLIIKNIHTIY